MISSLFTAAYVALAAIVIFAIALAATMILIVLVITHRPVRPTIGWRRPISRRV